LKYAYYPGCSLGSTGIEFGTSCLQVAKTLGIDLWEIPDYNCCGASAAHLTNHKLALALPARNLAIAEKEGLDVAIPCAACYARFKATAKAVKDSPETQAEIAGMIDMDYQASGKVISMMDLLAKEITPEAIQAKMVLNLNGMKVASYYGCLLVRPHKIADSGDWENPMAMDEIVTTLGGEAVDWGFKTVCCGAGHVVTNPTVGQDMIYEILRNAELNGAEAIACACPLCGLNLDMRQKQINARHGTKFQIPIYYFTELMALTFGYTPAEVGLQRHFVPAEKLAHESLHREIRREEA